MVKSLEDLKREREALLRKANARASLQSLSTQRELERKKIQAELRALKNPRSIQARRIAINFSRKVSIGVSKGGKILMRGINIIAERQANADRFERMQKKRKSIKKKRRVKK